MSNSHKPHTLVANTINGVPLVAPYKEFGTVPMWARFVEDGDKENLTTRRIDMVKQVVLREIQRVFQVSCGFTIQTYDAPIRVSAYIPTGYYAIDAFGNITVNEAWATDHCWDCDGDRGMVMADKDTKQAIIIKYPITRMIEVLELWDRPITEHFSDCTYEPKPLKTTLTDEEYEAYARKAQTDPKVGEKTKEVDAYEAWLATTLNLRGDDARAILGKDDTRIDLIEKGGLKMNRDKNSTMEHGTLEHTYALPEEVEMLLHKSGEPIEDLLLNWNIREAQQAIWDFHFIVDKDDRGNPMPKWDPPTIQYRKERLYERLISMKMLDVKEHEHQASWLGNVLQFTIRNVEGKPVALMSNKRDKSEINYTNFVLPMLECIPVWIDVDGNTYQNHEVCDVDGVLMTKDNVLVKLSEDHSDMKIVSPREIMIRALGKVYFEDETYNEYLASGVNFWQVLGKRPDIAARIIRVLGEEIGRHGYNAITINGEPNAMTKAMAARNVIVDFKTTSCEKKVQLIKFMRDMISGLNEIGVSKHHLALTGGDKGNSRPIQKFGLSDAHSKPVWAKPGTNPKRMDEISSQLQQSHACGYANILITGPGHTEQQMFATPKGFEHQKLPFGLFMPTLVDPTTEPNAVPHTYSDLIGRRETVYLVNKRQTALAGKILLGHYGTKNQLAPLGFDLVAKGKKDNYDVHYVMSQTEFENKDCLDAVLTHDFVEDVEVIVNNQLVRGKLVRCAVFRTLNTAENKAPSQARHHVCRYPAHMILHGVKTAGLQHLTNLSGDLPLIEHMPDSELRKVYLDAGAIKKGLGNVSYLSQFPPADEDYLRDLRAYYVQLTQLGETLND